MPCVPSSTCVSSIAYPVRPFVRGQPWAVAMEIALIPLECMPSAIVLYLTAHVKRYDVQPLHLITVFHLHTVFNYPLCYLLPFLSVVSSSRLAIAEVIVGERHAVV